MRAMREIKRREKTARRRVWCRQCARQQKSAYDGRCYAKSGYFRNVMLYAACSVPRREARHGAGVMVYHAADSAPVYRLLDSVKRGMMSSARAHAALTKPAQRMSAP